MEMIDGHGSHHGHGQGKPKVKKVTKGKAKAKGKKKGAKKIHDKHPGESLKGIPFVILLYIRFRMGTLGFRGSQMTFPLNQSETTKTDINQSQCLKDSSIVNLYALLPLGTHQIARKHISSNHSAWVTLLYYWL
jgi:hypothetical protein